MNESDDKHEIIIPVKEYRELREASIAFNLKLIRISERSITSYGGFTYDNKDVSYWKEGDAIEEISRICSEKDKQIKELSKKKSFWQWFNS